MTTTRQKRQKRERVSGRQRAAEHKTSSAGTLIRLPEGVNFFSVKNVGPFRLEILSYIVPSGGGNPWKADGAAHFERTFWSHRIGPNGDPYVCLAKTLKKPCPICEACAKIASDPDGDEETAKALLPKERQLWNVYNHAEPDKGVQVWEVSFHNFGKQLDAAINNVDEDEDFEFFSDPEDGSTLRVGFEEKYMGKTKYFAAESINFKARKTPLDPEIVGAANILDDLLIIEPYDKLKAIFLGEEPDDDGDDDDDEPEPTPRKKRSKPPVKKATSKAKPKPATADEFGIEKGSDVSHDEFGACEVVKISGDGTSLTLMDEDDELHKVVGPDEVKVVALDDDDIPFEDEDDEPEPTPKKKSAKTKTKAKSKKKEPDPDPDDDDDPDPDDDDDEDWGDFDDDDDDDD